MSTQEKDMGLKRIIAAVKVLEKRSVKIGVQSGSGKGKSGVDVLDYAVYNEFGTKDIPSRPFMRATADANRATVGKLGEAMLGQVYAGMGPETALRQIGAQYEKIQKDNIKNGPWAPNSPETIRRKGSSKPLIDHGVLIGAIRYEVE